ncbi:MAG: adenine deaminase [Proteobacteria bacterium]|nr:adenine deaminase [Pseudomonadota bacterium]
MRQAYFKYRREANAERAADLVLRHCRLVNVLSGEIEEDVSIAISGFQVVGIGPWYEGEQEIDVGGRYVYPGFVDAHIHLESTKLTIPEIGRVMARYGTSTVITDPHEIANVASLDGIAFQMDTASDNGYLNVFFTAPSCVPALADNGVETYGAYLGPSKLRFLMQSPWVVGLGEVMNVPGLLNGDAKVLRKLKDFQERHLVIDGHAPLLGGPALNTCIYLGVNSDHESTELEEAREKLRRGMHVMIREGSSEKNLDALLPLINEHNVSRLMFASDDLDPTDLMARGHINHLVRRTVAFGVPAIRAIQMATLTPATYFGLNTSIGAIFPGALADLVIAPDLEHFMPDMVIHHGRLVYHDGQTLSSCRSTRRYLKPSINVKLPNEEALAVPSVSGKLARAISLIPGQILTNEVFFKPKTKDGMAVPSASQNIAKVCVFERHHGSGAFGVGFVHGFGMTQGAMGSSVAHDSHNIIVVGMSDADILQCAREIRNMDGGQAAVWGDRVERLPLPIGGLMSNQDAETVVALELKLSEFCAAVLGVTLPNPMAALSFMCLPVIPALRITDQGVFRIAPGGYPERVDIFEGQA